MPVLAFGVMFWASIHVRTSLVLDQHLRPPTGSTVEEQRQAAANDIITITSGGAGGAISSSSSSSSSSFSSSNKLVEYHIVFSTGCSAFQDWQSFLFYHQAWKSGQPGTVTRIVSGCQPDEQVTLQRIFDDQISPMLLLKEDNNNERSKQRFAIHFTPDYSRVKPRVNYKYFNKPYGMKHWMENALGFPSNPQNEEAIVILMDPDQLIIRPFVDNNFTNTAWKFVPKNETPYVRIQHGRPMGQMYGFYLQWKQKINMTLVLQDSSEYSAANDELPSPVDALDNTQAQRGYIVGPPYIATARDMYAIVNKWSQFAPKVHDQYPYLLAEMFAYCLAAAHLRLPHQTAASFMVSDIDSSNGEGWKSHVDTIPNDQVCGDATSPTVRQHREAWPNVIHFCQRYGWGPYL
jgi:peptidyl serine alpha-galactosyltransferase